MEQQAISLWDAIREMRQISKKKGSFKMVFVSYSRTRGTSEGFVEVQKARLRPQPDTVSKYSDSMLNYVDLDTNEEKTMWQPLLIEFNGKKTVLK